jgi:hypothetical protein
MLLNNSVYRGMLIVGIRSTINVVVYAMSILRTTTIDDTVSNLLLKYYCKLYYTIL